MTFHTGQSGFALLGSTGLPLLHWQVQPTAELIEFRNSKSGATPIRDSSFTDAIVSFQIDFDFDANPYASITAGATLSSVKLYLLGPAGDYWDLPSLVIEGCPQQLDVNGQIVTRVNCRIDGPFGYPGYPLE
jgi:hypothetical protein